MPLKSTSGVSSTRNAHFYQKRYSRLRETRPRDLSLFVVAFSLRRNDDFYFFIFLTFSFLSTLSRETPTFGVHFLLLGVSGGPPAAWAPEGSTYSFYQHSRAKRSFSLLVASWALLGPGCPRAFSGTSSSILCAGAVFGDTHVAVGYTWLLMCLSWRPLYTVKTNTNSIWCVLCKC